MVSTLDSTPNSLSYLSANAADSTEQMTSPNQKLLPLSAEVSEQDHLVIGGCDVPELIERFGSPLYILDESTLRLACQQYRDAMTQHYPGESLVIYASKAWSCLAVCAVVNSEDLGIDVVSGGELLTATQAGVSANHLYFHGNNKSAQELQMGIDVGCRIVVDNWFELKLLTQCLKESDTTASILLRLTPGIECHTHEYIRTGHLDSKFGFDPDQLEDVFKYVAQQPQIQCIGLHAHIGSQIFELQPHQDLAEVMVRWIQVAREYGLPISELDIGGGLGICYTESDDPPSIHTWVKTVAESVVQACKELGASLPRLICEPGRSLIGSACVTAYTVGSQKTVPGIRTYVAVDGGMSDNPRPITYQSVYRALVANRMSAPLTEKTTLAGKHCESGDVIIQEASLPSVQPNDIVVVAGTGAYNYSMASNYNRVPRPAAVLVKDGEAHLIIKRETLQDLIRHDCLPEALAPTATPTDG
ncbi:diaminopimelate decarboxylase [Oscillatoria sp. CS-180]|uniref:diaminopimelate decarboxylase n=1 Tax=Oscillatoria sp. CS-180 TaxID=3021720 RepID=UPI00232F4EE2|nr:diaminopimelate decarboxylase [Oscillatoria sp. CS-180]MDB9525010.1 diaminopimelate decarboxylase [Oscillatoria sp. CS-180]